MRFPNKSNRVCGRPRGRAWLWGSALVLLMMHGQANGDPYDYVVLTQAGSGITTQHAATAGTACASAPGAAVNQWVIGNSHFDPVSGSCLVTSIDGKFTQVLQPLVVAGSCPGDEIWNYEGQQCTSNGMLPGLQEQQGQQFSAMFAFLIVSVWWLIGMRSGSING